MSRDLALLAELLAHHGDDPEAALALDALLQATAPVTVTPSPARAALRDRVLRSAKAQPTLAEQLATLFDVAIDAARAHLGRLHEIAGWVDFAPGAQLLHLGGGPATAGADVGFVRVADGTDFPPHVHEGHEHNLVLRGAVVEHDGQRFVAGQTFSHPPGSHHVFRAEGDLVFAVVVWGVRFEGGLEVHPE